jgi:hypothetical protein
MTTFERMPEAATGPWYYDRATGTWTHGLGLRAPARRAAGLTAAEIEVRRLRAAAGQATTVAESSPTGAPSAPSDAGTRAERHRLNEWSREQARIAAEKQRERAGGAGR